MQFTPQELREKLLRAIDEDNHVLDMRDVLEVISTLERYPVTKELLEQTRIGKLVNDLRKKTSDKDLARRAKNLVKRWRDFVTPPTCAVVNGENTRTPAKGEINNLSCHQHRWIPGAGSKPASPNSGPATPSSARSNVSPPSLVSNASTGSSRPGTPSVSIHSRVSPRLISQNKPASPLVNASYTTGDTPNSKKHSPKLINRQLGNYKEGAVTSCEVTRPATPTETVSKFNVANKRKRRGDPLNESSIKPAKNPMICDKTARSHQPNNNGDSLKYRPSVPPVNGTLDGEEHYSKFVDRSNASQESLREVSNKRRVSPVNRTVSGADKIETPQHTRICERRNASSLSLQTDMVSNPDNTFSASSEKSELGHFDRTPSSSSLASRTPKVKTTVQLIQELHNTVGMRLSGSETVTKIAMNQIEREADLIPDSVVPPEAKPRYRRKPITSALAPPLSNKKLLNQSKKMILQQYLESSVEEASPPPNQEPNLINLIKQDKERVDSLAELFPAPSEEQEDSRMSFQSIETSYTLPKDSTEQSSSVDVDPWSLLPPLDIDSINWEEDTYTVPEPKIIGNEDVDRLEKEQWDGVNGRRDMDGTWHDWTSTYSLPSAEGHLLHILPYVCLDNGD